MQVFWVFVRRLTLFLNLITQIGCSIVNFSEKTKKLLLIFYSVSLIYTINKLTEPEKFKDRYNRATCRFRFNLTVNIIRCLKSLFFFLCLFFVAAFSHLTMWKNCQRKVTPMFFFFIRMHLN